MRSPRYVEDRITHIGLKNMMRHFRGMDGIIEWHGALFAETMAPIGLVSALLQAPLCRERFTAGDEGHLAVAGKDVPGCSIDELLRSRAADPRIEAQAIFETQLRGQSSWRIVVLPTHWVDDVKRIHRTQYVMATAVFGGLLGHGRPDLQRLGGVSIDIAIGRLRDADDAGSSWIHQSARHFGSTWIDIEIASPCGAESRTTAIPLPTRVQACGRAERKLSRSWRRFGDRTRSAPLTTMRRVVARPVKRIGRRGGWLLPAPPLPTARCGDRRAACRSHN